MLEIAIPQQELFDEVKNEFIYIKPQVLRLEHSLVSISKWESIWQKPFLDKEPKTNEETIDYIRCMTITQNVDPIVYLGITRENIKAVSDYIDSPMSATWFSKTQERPRAGRDIITSELIYYWMIALNIPMECQKWHLNRLLTLIRICNIKNQDPKKMSKSAIMSNNKALNAARRAKHHSKG